MKANERTLAGILISNDQFVIPAFQRYYKWKRGNWEKLWDDLIELKEKIPESGHHFMGTMVLVPGSPVPGAILPYQLIDGQQRLITLSLLPSAIRNLAKENGWVELANEIHEN